MQNLTIGRFDSDPTAQGVVKPADGRWQLVLDKDGYPHLYVQVKVKEDTGAIIPGMLALDDLLPDKMTIQSLMDGGAFEGQLPLDEEIPAFQEYVADRARNPIPCPR